MKLIAEDCDPKMKREPTTDLHGEEIKNKWNHLPANIFMG